MSCEPAIRANQVSKVLALGLTGRKIPLATIAKNWIRMIPLEAAHERSAQDRRGS
jgi:hypothetical protein